MTATPRYALDTDRATTILTLVAKVEDHDNGTGPDLTDAENHDVEALVEHGVGEVYLGTLDLYDRERDSDLATLIEFAWSAGLVTGPDAPEVVIEDDGYMWRISLGEYPATVRLTSTWEEVRKLGDRQARGAARAVSILAHMVSDLNSVLTEHDNYLRAATRPTHVPDGHHALYLDSELVATFYARPATVHPHGKDLADPVAVSLDAPGGGVFLADVYADHTQIGTWPDGEEWDLARVVTNDDLGIGGPRKDVA